MPTSAPELDPMTNLTPRRCRTRTGFTLVELLVVMSIIGVLLALLLPTLSKARETARQAMCASNLKQLGIGIHAYANDFEDESPRGPDVPHGFLGPFGFNFSDIADAQIWARASSDLPNGAFTGYGVLFEGYLRNKEVMFCPSDNTNDPTVELERMGDPDQDAFGSFIYRNLDAIADGKAKLSAHRQNIDMFGNTYGPVTALAFDRQALFPDPGGSLQTNHRNEVSNMLFTDGRVQLFSNEQNLWTLRPEDMTIFPLRLDQMMINADHAGRGLASDFPFP